MTHRGGKLPLSPCGQIQDVLIHSEAIVSVCFSAVAITGRSIRGWEGGGGELRERAVGPSRGERASGKQVDSDSCCQLTCRYNMLVLERKDITWIMSLIIKPTESIRNKGWFTNHTILWIYSADSLGVNWNYIISCAIGGKKSFVL